MEFSYNKFPASRLAFLNVSLILSCWWYSHYIPIDHGAHTLMIIGILASVLLETPSSRYRKRLKQHCIVYTSLQSRRLVFSSYFCKYALLEFSAEVGDIFHRTSFIHSSSIITVQYCDVTILILVIPEYCSAICFYLDRYRNFSFDCSTVTYC